MTDERKRQIPPYVPWRTFETYLDGLKAFGPDLPNVIDRDSMRTFSGAMQSWLLNALRSLNMIDDNGVPRPRLKQIVHATPESRKAMYKQVLEAEYRFLDGINLRAATPKQIEAAFETTGATGDTIRKCMVFFVGLAKAAEVPLSPLIMKVRRRPSRSNGGNPKPKRGPIPSSAHNLFPPAGGETTEPTPTGFERLPIPGLPNAFIQYPAGITEANCDLFDAMVSVLRTYAKGRLGGKERKS
jgi:hypothetical protein